jgi:CubicO group peptidase (beta-lactamase class C family)
MPIENRQSKIENRKGRPFPDGRKAADMGTHDVLRHSGGFRHAGPLPAGWRKVFAIIRAFTRSWAFSLRTRVMWPRCWQQSALALTNFER